MIEYSVFMMQNPANRDEARKAYGKNQVREVWDLNQFCKHIASHNSGYSRGLVKAVLSDMCECLIEQLLNGNKITLGELGSFSTAISCKPAESKEAFTEDNIKEVNINFKPGEDFVNLRSRAQFKLVASRMAQAAVLKAEKKDQTSVDLNASKDKE